MKKITILLIFMLGFGALEVAFSAEKEKEFANIGKMGVRELTAAAKAALEKKYPLENWEKYKFPKYVYTNDGVQNGYKIAVKQPEVLAKFPCYCFCEEMGHKNLAYCFLEKGILGKFDDHASTCNICYTEAMRVFLWNELGASEEEIQKVLKEIYGK